MANKTLPAIKPRVPTVLGQGVTPPGLPAPTPQYHPPLVYKAIKKPGAR